MRRLRHLRHPGAMMRLGRIVVSMLMLAMITLVCTGLGGAFALKLGWCTHIQIMPLAMGGAVSGVVVWLLVTVLFGRLFCSWVCPLGATQDVVSRLPRMRRTWRRKHPYRFGPAANGLRYSVFMLVSVCAIAGIAVVPALLDPMSIYGRFASEIIRPVALFIGGKSVAVASVWACGIAVATLTVVGVLAWRRGRLWCNTVCPVGAGLSIFSRYSLYHIEIDPDVCTACRSCEHVCKSNCINVEEHTVDGSRCVMCFDCTDVCPAGAIRYTIRRKRLSWPLMQKVAGTAASAMKEPPVQAPVKDTSATSGCVPVSRRQFLATGMIAAAMPLLAVSGDDSERHPAPVAPPGRRSMHRFLDTCTACGICVANCPTKVLVPSLNEYGWLHTMQPRLDFSRGYCDFNCTRCTDVCPSGALEPLTLDEKHIFIIGKAQVQTDLCIGCGRCMWSCPKQAISMNREAGRERPYASVDPSLCIGCGKCQSVCPVSPLTAIYVSGV